MALRSLVEAVNVMWIKRQSTEARSRLPWLMVAVAAVFALNNGSINAFTQPQPAVGPLFVTQVAASPEGALLTPLNLSLGLYTILINGLSQPPNITCGPLGRLFYTEVFSPESKAASVVVHQEEADVVNLTYHRLSRLTLDGSAPKHLVEWDNLTMEPSSFVIAPDGNLYLGTTSEDGQPTAGLWRIGNVLNGEDGVLPPEQLLSSEQFLIPGEFSTSYSVRPMGILNDEPFEGDLLILDTPVESFVPGGRILRAVAPEFTQVETWVPAFVDPETQRPFKPAGLTITRDRFVLVTDFANDKILKFDQEGRFLDVFATVMSPNQIAAGSDGRVYVTNVEFRGRNVRGGLLVFDGNGSLMERDGASLFLRGVTVCNPA